MAIKHYGQDSTGMILYTITSFNLNLEVHILFTGYIAFIASENVELRGRNDLQVNDLTRSNHTQKVSRLISNQW